MRILVIIFMLGIITISCNKDADAIETDKGNTTQNTDSLTEVLVQQLAGTESNEGTSNTTKSNKSSKSSGVIPECSCNYGQMDWNEWKEKSSWADVLSDGYEYNNAAIQKIQNNYSDEEEQILVFGGMWCPDSEISLPIIFEILEKAGIDENDEVDLYSVDEDKAEPTHTAVQMNIHKVPTVIVMKNNIEVGRISEFPQISWEEDLAAILENE